MKQPSPPLFRPRLLEMWSQKQGKIPWGTEIISGMTVGLIALPLALALGIASIPAGADTGLPAPAIGIITAILAGTLISALGGSRVQIGGPTAAFIPIVLLIIQEHGFQGLLISTFMAGGILIMMGLARMGTLIKYIPWPVTSGFTTGIAVSIMLSQVPDLLGLHNAAPREFFEKIAWLVHHAGKSNPYTTVLGSISIAIIFVWPKLKLKRIPGSIVAMLFATLLVLIWKDAGVETIATKFGADALSSGFPRPKLRNGDGSGAKSGRVYVKRSSLSPRS